jgi:hypothetical protein
LTFIGYACKKQGKMAKAQSVWSLGLEKCRHKISDIELLDELRRLVASKELSITDVSKRKEENETQELDRDRSTTGEEKVEVKTLQKESKEDAQVAANAFLEQLALRRLTGGVNTDLGVVWYEI